ncbi:MAG: RNA polymerase sigma factor [Lachnospiraceae bacterium]|nr:RNA polymerase sigma factor [Lachnospiraceae bacterium]
MEQLYNSYYKELYLYVYGLCRQKSMTEDILQETFLKALIALKDSHTNMRAWLYLVARNLCFNSMKKEKNTVPEDREAVLGKHRSAGREAQQDVLEEILQSERRKMLWEALCRLDGRRREILLLQYFGGFSQKEIAAMLRLSPENVRVQVYRAKKELKSFLEVMHYDIS